VRQRDERLTEREAETARIKEILAKAITEIKSLRAQGEVSSAWPLLSLPQRGGDGVISPKSE